MWENKTIMEVDQVISKKMPFFLEFIRLVAFVNLCIHSPIYVFEGQGKRELPCAGSLPNAYNSQGLAWLKTGAWDPIQVSHVGDRDPAT